MPVNVCFGKEKADVRVDITLDLAADAGHTVVHKNNEIAVQAGFRGTFGRAI